MNAAPRPVSVEPLSPLDERYIANVVMREVMTATVTLFLEAETLLAPDGGFDETAIRRRIDAATWATPALRKRLMAAPFALTPAAWVPVDSLDLTYHVTFHPEPLAEGSSSAAVLAGRSQPRLDVRRPMWRIRIARLESGTAALIFTWHHVLGDAAYGLQILKELFGPTPGSPLRAVTDHDRAALGRAPRSGAELLRAVRALEATRRGSRPSRRTRGRRWAARLARPVRDAALLGTGVLRRLPAKEYRVLHLELAAAERYARAAGGSLTDVVVALTFAAIFTSRPELASGALLVPISRRQHGRDGRARNVMSATLVTVPAERDPARLVPLVHDQIVAGVRGSTMHDGARFGYATMVPSGETDRWFGDARILSVAGWPAGDPRDDIAVLANSFADELTVAVSASVGSRIDDLVATIAASLPSARVAS